MIENKIDKKKIGLNIKRVISANGYTLKSFSKYSNISYDILKDIINGRVVDESSMLNYIYKICEILNIDDKSKLIEYCNDFKRIESNKYNDNDSIDLGEMSNDIEKLILLCLIYYK
ncbi:helix-turn-helix domain-containing protein [Clostridium perfringens]|uniref:Putative transcriptional regulator n=1 Tax=Clostridium perfringens TaxID=1502 RepID=A0A140GS38_CLOPF|nr:helix-turn-helix domain-containing protein [Clostridium perfringens]AMN31347.1 putative transcriptional regulator [Clostridium perfringens]